MKVRFKGTVEKIKKGCPVCGKRRIDSQFSLSKTYILPSGVAKTFRAGKIEEVSIEDAQFLSDFTYIDHNGTVQNVFEVL